MKFHVDITGQHSMGEISRVKGGSVGSDTSRESAVLENGLTVTLFDEKEILYSSTD